MLQKKEKSKTLAQVKEIFLKRVNAVDLPPAKDRDIKVILSDLGHFLEYVRFEFEVLNGYSFTAKHSYETSGNTRVEFPMKSAQTVKFFKTLEGVKKNFIKKFEDMFNEKYLPKAEAEVPATFVNTNSSLHPAYIVESTQDKKPSPNMPQSQWFSLGRPYILHKVVEYIDPASLLKITGYVDSGYGNFAYKTNKGDMVINICNSENIVKIPDTQLVVLDGYRYFGIQDSVMILRIEAQK